MIVLTIGAHPDDVELGCGGTLAKLLQQGARVHALILTRGEAARQCSAVDRCAESRAALMLLGLDESDIHSRDFGDTRLADRLPDVISAIAAMLDLVRPDTVFVPAGYHDEHQDHRAALHAALAALRSTLRPITILCYRTMSWLPGWRPRVFEVLSPELFALKLRALAEHRSQRAKTCMRHDLIEACARFWACQAGVPSGLTEAFEAIRIVGC